MIACIAIPLLILLGYAMLVLFQRDWNARKDLPDDVGPL